MMSVDKGDIAIAIALASAAFTGLQWLTSRETLRLQKQQAKRKKPIFEMCHRPLDGHPDWCVVEVTIRNRADATVHVAAVRASRRHRMRLFDYERALTRDEDGQLRLLCPPALSTGTHMLPLDINLRPASDMPQPRSGQNQFAINLSRHFARAGTTTIVLLAYGRFSRTALHWDWQWSDGVSP